MSDENAPEGGATPPKSDDRPERKKLELGPPVSETERSERSPEDRPQLGPRREGPRDGPRDGPRGGGDFRGRGRDDRPRTPQTVKGRLRARARKKARKQRKKMFQRRKVCRFCADKKLELDYKEPKTLRLFLTETGKVIPRRISGNCAKHQRPLALAIKRARHIALLPYAAGHM